VALVWQEAANAQDADLLLAISDPQIAIVGPRGTGHGRDLLREWLARAGLSLTTLRAFVHDDEVVLAQHGVWHDPATGARQGEQELASCFQVRDRRVVRFARYDTLEEALVHSQMTPADEITGVADR